MDGPLYFHDVHALLFQKNLMNMDYHSGMNIRDENKREKMYKNGGFGLIRKDCKTPFAPQIHHCLTNNGYLQY